MKKPKIGPGGGERGKMAIGGEIKEGFPKKRKA